MGALTVADVLDRAADLIEPEGAWTQGSYARGKSGRTVVAIKSAVCFCALGAINVAAGSVRPNCDAGQYQDAFKELAGVRFVPAWNDASERTQAEVVAKLREAARLARGESPHV